MKPVWIVDDDPSIRFVLERALARAQLPVRAFAGPHEVIAALAREGLAVPEFNADGSKRATVRLGMADLSYDSVALLGPNAEAAGFYAIAYDVSGVKDEHGRPLFGDSGTVISYRG